MKTYEEVAKSVFEKSEEYFKEKAVRAKRIKTAVSAISCVCLAAALLTVAGLAMNGNLTEYPLSGGGSGGITQEPFTGDENNGGIPEYTTTAITEELTDIDDEDFWQNGEAFSTTGKTNNYIWQTPGEVLGKDGSITTASGVNVGTFIAYDGALYVSYTPEDTKTDRQYALIGEYAFFGEGFPIEVYAVKDEPNLIAIKLNFAIWEYRRLFNCNFEISGEKFEIAHSALMDIDYICRNKGVLQTEDFTVYEAVRLQGEPSDTKEYLVDILPVLEREFPDLFSGTDTEYGDAWWIAIPSSAADERSHYTIPDDKPSLPLNTLTGVTPDDIDGILAPAAAAAYSAEPGKSTSVFVPAETGTEIYSLVEGEVVMAEYYLGLGYTVEVKMDNGSSVKHFHLSEMLAEVGDKVTRGQVIGLAGTTGITFYSGAGYRFIPNNGYNHIDHDDAEHTTAPADTPATTPAITQDPHHSDTHHTDAPVTTTPVTTTSVTTTQYTHHTDTHHTDTPVTTTPVTTTQYTHHSDSHH